MLAMPLLMLFAGLRLPSLNVGRQWKTSLTLGLGVGVVIFAAILGIFIVFEPFFTAFAEPVGAKIVEVGILPFYWIAASVMSLGHSLFEEYFWRWYVVNGLATKLPVPLSMIVGNILFALHHYVILSQFAPWPLVVVFGALVGVAGYTWSHIYLRTGSLLGAWVSHAFADAAIFFVGYLLVT